MYIYFYDVTSRLAINISHDTASLEETATWIRGSHVYEGSMPNSDDRPSKPMTEWTNWSPKNNQTHTQTNTLLSKIYQISISCGSLSRFSPSVFASFFLWSNRQGDWKTTFAKITSETKNTLPCQMGNKKEALWTCPKDAKQTITLIFWIVYINTNFSWSMLGKQLVLDFQTNKHEFSILIHMASWHNTPTKKRTCFHDLARPVHPPYTY